MIFLDLETSGDDDFIKYGIASIGAVEFEEPHRNFYAEPLLPHTKEVLQAALDINGFTEWELRGHSKPNLEHVLKNFRIWYERCHNLDLAGHNIGQFDVRYLKQAFKECGIEWPFGFGVVDLRSAYISHCKQRGIELPQEKKRNKAHFDDILEFVGLPRRPDPKTSKKKHNALDDARLTAEAYSRLIYGANLIPECANYEIPERLCT